MSLGAKLKYLRDKKQVNQKEVAEYLGFGVSTYSQYENDLRSPDYNTLRKLRDFFDIGYEFLLDDFDLAQEDDYNHDFFGLEFTLFELQDVLRRSRKIMTRLDSLIGEQNEQGEFEYYYSALAELFEEYQQLVQEIQATDNILDLHDVFLEYLGK